MQGDERAVVRSYTKVFPAEAERTHAIAAQLGQFRDNLKNLLVGCSQLDWREKLKCQCPRCRYCSYWNWHFVFPPNPCCDPQIGCLVKVPAKLVSPCEINLLVNSCAAAHTF